MIQIWKYVTELDSNQKINPTASVFEAIGKTKSSHYPLYVFDDDTFLGIVWPFHLLYQNQPERHSKLSNFLVNPPKLTQESDALEAFNYMLSDRVYELPVYGKDNRIAGAVSAPALIADIIKDPQLRSQIVPSFKPVKPLTVPRDIKVRSLVAKMREARQSKAVVVGDGNKMVGIVSRRDLYLSYLDKTDQMKVGGNYGERSALSGKILENEQNLDISKIYTQEVQFLSEKSDLIKIYELLATGQKSSVILVDNSGRATGIVTWRTFLKSVIDSRTEFRIPIMVTDKHETMSVFRRMEIFDVLQKFVRKYEKKQPMTDIETSVDAVVKAEEIARYEISTRLQLQSGASFFAKAYNHNLRPALQETLVKIKSQLQRQK